MADIKINLLPWREELREQKKKEFLNVLAGVVVIAGGIIFAIDQFYRAEIDGQNARNKFLEDEIVVLDEKIAEISNLQTQRNQLLTRKKVIEELQGNRPIIVRVFDELARNLADNVFYTKLVLEGKKLDVAGVAKSHNRISTQLRNFDESDWFTKPNVTAIRADPNYGSQAQQFTMTVEQTTPQKEETP
jgi:type IV pilus assembly protein PilN|tara:strand:- start:6161 stop:6727 length:567 start_codon:yes stop_codon:yes gene_type:complete